jgi:TPR repeat protein
VVRGAGIVRIHNESTGDAGASISTMRNPLIDQQTTIDSPVRRMRTAQVLLLVLTGVFLALGFASHARTNSHLAWTFCGVAAFLLCWQLALFVRSQRKGLEFKWEFVAVRSHYMQALVQLAIYVYWGWYWRKVYGEFSLILSQVAFFYIFDGLLSWSRGQTWRLGFGPWPIILGSNLFMWFRDDWFVFQFLMIITGVLGKQFIRWRRDGKMTHIFNPSAFALTLFSLVLIFTGNSDLTWGEQIATTLAKPPHIYLLIFLCGVVVQYFFSVTLLTLSAAGVISLLGLAYTKTTGVYLFVDSNIPIAIFLGLHLLMTDPATTPRSSIGKIIFGGLYGACVFEAYIVLRAFGIPEFYDKLLVVPLLNLLTPLLDRLAAVGPAGKFGRWEAVTGPRKMNLGFMGCWMVLFIVMLTTGFVEGPHPGNSVQFWEKAAEEKRPHATQNLFSILNNFIAQDTEYLSLPPGAMSEGQLRSIVQNLGYLYNHEGSIYVQGTLVPPDLDKAAYFFTKACDFGNSDGCANLAIQSLFLNRAGSPVDVSNALASLEQKCNVSTNINGTYCYLVGYAYDVGHGRPEDKTKARQFYEKGAALEDLDAAKNVARMQLNGEGGPPDHAAAAFWLQKAVDARDGQSCLFLARLYHNGDGVPRDEQRAVALLEKACGLGVQPACVLLQQSRR